MRGGNWGLSLGALRIGGMRLGGLRLDGRLAVDPESKRPW